MFSGEICKTIQDLSYIMHLLQSPPDNKGMIISDIMSF